MMIPTHHPRQNIRLHQQGWWTKILNGEFYTIEERYAAANINCKRWHMRLSCLLRRLLCPNDGLLALSFFLRPSLGIDLDCQYHAIYN